MSHFAPHSPHELRAKRLRFLRTLSTIDETGQRHLLRIETVAELRDLQQMATGETRLILDSMLGGLDAKHAELCRHLGFEDALAAEVFDPNISDAEYFKRRRDYHEIR